MNYIYILQSKVDGRLYTGFTTNLTKRFIEHNQGLSRSTKSKRPWNLIYYESYLDIRDARVREKYLKTGWGRNYIKKTLKHYLSVKI